MRPILPLRRLRRRERRTATVGAVTSMVLVSLLGGLALVVFALRDLHLRVELRRRPGAENEPA